MGLENYLDLREVKDVGHAAALCLGLCAYLLDLLDVC
tara:strand:+ start:687 stop:797 length:111 start_codon:yes stop_codon:yes gene_type:complete